MKINKFKKALMGVLLLVALPVQAQDFGGRNGGDPMELRFQEIALDIQQWMAKGGAKSLQLPSEISLSDYEMKMNAMLKMATVSFTPNAVIVDGAEKVCINFPAVKVIQCNVDRFKNLSEAEQYMLVHHEYAGLAGLETNTGSKSDYSISAQITYSLETVLVRKLAVRNANSILGMEFKSLPGGTFMMGSPRCENGRENDETQHSVTVSGFQMQVTDVTQMQYFKVMGSNPSWFKAQTHCPNQFVSEGGGICPNHPVEQVSWNDAQNFVDKMNTQNDGYTYRLPTEAEWEYAARAGTTTAYSFGNSSSLLREYAWYDENSGGGTHEVKTKKPNAFGLYDMHGNVWQWVQDWYGSYSIFAAVNPQVASGLYHVLRGGSWGRNEGCARSAGRYFDNPGNFSYSIGFRLVRTPR